MQGFVPNTTVYPMCIEDNFVLLSGVLPIKVLPRFLQGVNYQVKKSGLCERLDIHMGRTQNIHNTTITRRDNTAISLTTGEPSFTNDASNTTETRQISRQAETHNHRLDKIISVFYILFDIELERLPTHGVEKELFCILFDRRGLWRWRLNWWWRLLLKRLWRGVLRLGLLLASALCPLSASARGAGWCHGSWPVGGGRVVGVLGVLPVPPMRQGRLSLNFCR